MPAQMGFQSVVWGSECEYFFIGGGDFFTSGDGENILGGYWKNEKFQGGHWQKIVVVILDVICMY